MPVVIHRDLPAGKILKSEGVFVIDDRRAKTQDIRPLRLGILNLMPTKITTETQLLRLISNTPLQVEIQLIRPVSHESKNTSREHLEKFYRNFDEIRNQSFDAFIITGAPVERLNFEDVDYWEELGEVFDFVRKNSYSTLFICWAVQAALYYYYGIEKKDYPEKLCGVFPTKTLQSTLLTKGFDDEFYLPHSRYTFSDVKQIQQAKDLEILCASEVTGPSVFQSKDERFLFLTGHGEYDPDTLKKEYERDLIKGLEPKIPSNYFEKDNPKGPIINRWMAHSNLLFSNWLNYLVYQKTPYDLRQLTEKKISN